MNIHHVETGVNRLANQHDLLVGYSAPRGIPQKRRAAEAGGKPFIRTSRHSVRKWLRNWTSFAEVAAADRLRNWPELRDWQKDILENPERLKAELRRAGLR